MKFPKIDTLRFSSHESLISGNLKDDSVKYTPIDTLESFGLFDYANANYSSFNPAGSANTTEEDFIYPIFRALSEVVIKRPNDWINFGTPALKKSMPLLTGQAVYANHEAFVGNEVGSVKNVFWQEAYSFTKDGKTYNIPAGMNAKFIIDAKTHTNLARKITMNPPAVHSNSVTVSFAWEKSHPNLSDEEFYNAMGKIQKDGKAVMRNVSHITRYNETSLVAHGADQFAQQIDKQGRIILPEYADSRSFMELPENKGKAYILSAGISYKTNLSLFEENTTTLDLSITSEDNISKLDNIMNLKEIATALGLTEDKVTEQEILTYITNAKATEVSLNEANTKIGTLTTDLSTANTKLVEAEKMGAVGTTALTGLRTEALRLYKLTTETPSAVIEKLIADSDYDAVLGLAKEYHNAVDTKLQATCKKCGSHEVSRASSLSGDANLGIGQNPVNSGTTPKGEIPKAPLKLNF